MKVGFYILPMIFTPEWDQKRLTFLGDKLGTPVQIMPFEYARVTYHHYRDMVHLLPQSRRFVSTWAASLIDPVEPN